MSIDPRTLRQTVGRFVTGVTVISMEIDGEIRAMTANSFTSLSLDPPLVLFCLGKDTKAGLMIHESPGFAVSILSHTQRDLSSYFAGMWRGTTPPPFTFIAWEGGPRLEGCVAAMGCRTHGIHEGGDHWIVVGQVIATHRDEAAGEPLVFFGGRYVGLQVN
jgi:flavin reductase (DIM6/NTAB) family NADH-FMN oxidoreductase RutF